MHSAELSAHLPAFPGKPAGWVGWGCEGLAAAPDGRGPGRLGGAGRPGTWRAGGWRPLAAGPWPDLAWGAGEGAGGAASVRISRVAGEEKARPEAAGRAETARSRFSLRVASVGAEKRRVAAGFRSPGVGLDCIAPSACI